ncbi:MAG: hypothetical protein GY705_06050 [Bacteroidetes bacterium]|nr:hypothetical protein [Bacteroidota bacterium]
MLRVPAVCDNCGTIFQSGFEATNATNISFYGCGAGPCPKCGGNGHIPDGIYNFIGNTIELLSGPSRTVSELRKLSEILRQAKENKTSHQELTSKIERQLPELSSIGDILPKTRTELYAFIAIIISVIVLILGQLETREPSKIEINNVINNIYQQQSNQPEKIAPVKKKKIGRNEPCPCGSGKKYKKCCLNKP